jgi:hypothetical protein
LVERHGLRGRVHDRGGEREVRFLARDRERLLPVRLDGRLQVVRWGCRRGQSRALPCTAWASVATLQGGGWGDREVTPVVIPAMMGVARGVWFPVRAGVRGIVVHDERSQPVAYVLVEPSTHYIQGHDAERLDARPGRGADLSGRVWAVSMPAPCRVGRGCQGFSRERAAAAFDLIAPPSGRRLSLKARRRVGPPRAANVGLRAEDEKTEAVPP